MDELTRRAWRRPELSVIVRGGPEETALWYADHTACAGAGAPTHHSGGLRNTTQTT